MWHAYSVTQSSPTFVTPWTAARQAPLSMGFSRQEYWSGVPFPSPGDLPNPGIEPMSLALAGDSLPLDHLENPYIKDYNHANLTDKEMTGKERKKQAQVKGMDNTKEGTGLMRNFLGDISVQLRSCAMVGFWR